MGLEYDLFSLGGHSLSARQVFRVEVPLRHLPGAPTAAGFAEAGRG